MSNKENPLSERARLFAENYAKYIQGGEAQDEVVENIQSGRVVIDQRKQLGFTRDELAQQYGLDPTDLFNFEHGQLPPSELEQKIANVYRDLGIDVGTLGPTLASSNDLGLEI